MNYKHIISKGYDEHKTQRTTYLSYFKSEANIAHRDNFIELADFFNGCKSALSDYKKSVENQYYKRLNENDLVVHAYKKLVNDGQTLDQNGNPIQEHIDYYENEKEFVKKSGYSKNSDYHCLITANGDITDVSLESKYTLDYSDIEAIEEGIIQSENDLIQKAATLTTDKNNIVNVIEDDKIVNVNDDDQINYSILLENFKFWNSIVDKLQGRMNIFKGITEQEFITMIKTANFTRIYNRGSKHRVKFNIFILSRVQDLSWGEKAANNLNTTLKDCAKRTDFYEYDLLKGMYLQ